MNKKRIWFVIPVGILPYLVLVALAVILFSTKVPLFEWIMGGVFQNNAWYVVAAVSIYALLTILSAVFCFVLSIRKSWDSLSLAKTAVIVKLIQIPAYLLIFVMGVLLLLTIFTIPFAIALFLFDCITLCLTGLLTIAAAVNAARQRYITAKCAIWVGVLQFVFVVDIVSTMVFFSKLPKK